MLFFKSSNMKNFLTLSLFAVLFSCSDSNSSSSEMKSMEVNANLMEVVAEPPSTSNSLAPKQSIPDKSSGKSDTISKKIIKNGRMEIQVASIDKSKLKIEEKLKKTNAYIQDESFRNDEYSESLNVKIRVPYQNFDALILSFSEGIGSVLSKNISSDDVTEEYTDVSIKLANKKIYLEKYRDLLKGASSTKDMLEIQEKIRGLEDEIDVAVGRLRFIDDQVNYSTLQLTLYKEKVRDSVTSRIGFGSRFADSISQGWNSFVGFMLGVISFWPIFLMIPILIFSFKKWKNRKKNKKE